MPEWMIVVLIVLWMVGSDYVLFKHPTTSAAVRRWILTGSFRCATKTCIERAVKKNRIPDSQMVFCYRCRRLRKGTP